MIVVKSPKLPVKVPAKPRLKQSKKSSPSTQPFLRFYHSETLRAKTLSVLAILEKSKDSTKHSGALAEIVVDLTDSGMEYYFLRPLKLAKVGFFAEQSACLGISATTGVFASVIRNMIGGMDHAQLLSVCRFIRQLME